MPRRRLSVRVAVLALCLAAAATLWWQASGPRRAAPPAGAVLVSAPLAGGSRT